MCVCLGSGRGADDSDDELRALSLLLPLRGHHFSVRLCAREAALITKSKRKKKTIMGTIISVRFGRFLFLLVLLLSCLVPLVCDHPGAGSSIFDPSEGEPRPQVMTIGLLN